LHNEKGIYHRDIKLENILLHKSYHVYLTDFGLSEYYSKDKEDLESKRSEKFVCTCYNPEKRDYIYKDSSRSIKTNERSYHSVPSSPKHENSSTFMRRDKDVYVPIIVEPSGDQADIDSALHQFSEKLDINEKSQSFVGYTPDIEDNRSAVSIPIPTPADTAHSTPVHSPQESDQAMSYGAGSAWYCPPEELAQGVHGSFICMCSKTTSGPKGDIWSMGVVLYAMLTGVLPFMDEYFPRLQKSIENAEYNTLPDYISEPAKHLVRYMLTVDRDNRFSIDQVLSHDWFTDDY
jgi:serine/threonine protein kinase